jgi:hypothetical protein
MKILTGILVLGFSVCEFASAATAKDACSLITPADAQAALGEPVGTPQSTPRSGGQSEGSMCRFRSTQGSAFKAKSLSLTVQYSSVNLTGSAPSMAADLKSAGFQNVQKIDGVGDAAIWGTSSMMGRSMGELSVIKGKSIMVIIIISGIPDQAVALDHAKALAAKVLPKT